METTIMGFIGTSISVIPSFLANSSFELSFAVQGFKFEGQRKRIWKRAWGIYHKAFGGGYDTEYWAF